MDKRTHYVRGEIVPFEEDLRHEFKGHRTIAIENRLINNGMFGSGPIGEYSNTRQHWSKYLCGMINTGVGGTLYGGIQDDGLVTGFMMSQYQRDHVIIQLQDVFDRFDPPVTSDKYNVRFVPIVDEGEEPVSDPGLSDPSLDNLDHFNLRSIYRCWCDNHAAAFHEFGLFFRFYIIEVEMKAQSAGTVYRAEDGFRYERQHGSTSNLDILANCPLVSSVSVRCHRCGELGHKASHCKTGNKKSAAVSSSSPRQLVVKCYECEEFGHSVRFCPNL